MGYIFGACSLCTVFYIIAAAVVRGISRLRDLEEVTGFKESSVLEGTWAPVEKMSHALAVGNNSVQSQGCSLEERALRFCFHAMRNLIVIPNQNRSVNGGANTSRRVSPAEGHQLLQQTIRVRKLEATVYTMKKKALNAPECCAPTGTENAATFTNEVKKLFERTICSPKRRKMQETAVTTWLTIWRVHASSFLLGRVWWKNISPVAVCLEYSAADGFFWRLRGPYSPKKLISGEPI